MNDNCELLFEYLRSTLYDKEPKQVEVDKLEPDFQKLGQGIAYLQVLIGDMLRYSADISQGHLNTNQPSKDNLLCCNLKNLNSNLQHLTWQAKQVAKGDYTQHVSYLGEFSDSFNLMISQLKEREEAINRRTALMEESNRFFLEVSSRRDEWIFIIQEDTREVLYCNRQVQKELFLESVIKHPQADQYHQQEVTDNLGDYYEISAFHMEWQGKKAVAFMVRDITKEKEQSNSLTQIAYNDSLTGVKNRQFFEMYQKSPNFESDWDMFCYMDLDGLKYVNDSYGHEEGDHYIKSFAEVIRNSFRSTDILIRMGGDEFCLFCNQIQQDKLEEKLEQIRSKFMAENTKPYEVSFSYGTVANTDHTIPFPEQMKNADDRMYQYKKAHKKERR